MTLYVGTKLYGYCNGFFHADYYFSFKTIESFGPDWIVAREEDGYPNFAYFPGGWVDYTDDIRKWMSPKELER